MLCGRACLKACVYAAGLVHREGLSAPEPWPLLSGQKNSQGKGRLSAGHELQSAPGSSRSYLNGSLQRAYFVCAGFVSPIRIYRRRKEMNRAARLGQDTGKTKSRRRCVGAREEDAGKANSHVAARQKTFPPPLSPLHFFFSPFALL
ncbi:hypothetical protein GQ54DRAFT_92797 [Martensiomyces pterosporus]|nr:hypothetical protein GQ54DRAFT_92797 [Martensiomyces pterosporus]